MMRLLRHLAAWIRRGRLDDELREELAQHVERRTEQLVAAGLSRAEARRQAAIAVGNVTRLREDSRATWGFPALDSIAQDVRYGLRQIARAPAFSAVAILSLGIGIGAGTAVFSLADTVLMRAMAVRDPAGLVLMRWWSGPVFPFGSLNGYGAQTDTGLGSTSFSSAAYRAFRHEADRFVDVLGFADLYQVTLSTEGRAEVGTAHAVSGNYFQVLGVGPVLGRALGEVDDAAAAAPAAVISYELWQKRFAGANDAVGHEIVVNNVAFTVVGVVPDTFHGTGQVGSNPDVYLPLAMRTRVLPTDDPPDDPNFWWVLMLGRLKPGVRLDETRAALDTLLKRTVAAAKPSLTAKDLPGVELVPGGRGQVEEREGMVAPLRTMALVTSVVLLVACANVAGLLLARGRARVRELSIRVAIGASRRRVVRQLLTEALLIGLAGCVVGIALATWLSAVLAPALSASSEPGRLLAGVDYRVLGFALVLSCGCAVLFGVMPALRATDLSVGADLQDTRGSIVGRPRRRLSSALVVSQVALTLTLVTGATLLVRTLRNLEHTALGFDAGNLLLFRIDPAGNGYDEARTLEVYGRVLDRLRGTPGVVSASLTSHKLISNSSAIGIVARPDEAMPPEGSPEMNAFGRSHRAWQLTIDERFFATMGIPVLRGRVFTAADGSGGPAVIVNRSLARQLYQTEDVVGLQLATATLRQRHGAAEIVGVVEDAHYTSIRDGMPPTAYFYYRHAPLMKNAATFEVRTSGAPGSLSAHVRDIVGEIDRTLPVYGVMTQADQVRTSLRQERLFARLATLLGVVALLLSAIGLYGLLAYNVTRRTAEIGVRMALGAARGRVLWMVFRESLTLAAIGLLAGIPLAVAGTRVLSSLLFGLAPGDPVALASAGAVMLTLAAAAGYLPARRASRVDPLTALRAE